MRIHGRILRPSTLAERRVLILLGVDSVLGLRVPRSHNPYMIARRIRRLALAMNADMQLLRTIAAKNKNKEPRPSPDLDLPAPFGDPLYASAAA